MACDVAQYLPQDDFADEEAERIVHSNLCVVRAVNRSGSARNRRRFRPKEVVELLVEWDQGDHLLLRAYRRGGGDLMAELHHRDVKVRSLHTHVGHRNPGGFYSLPDGHMHFPSTAFPMLNKSDTYAYELDCTDDDSLVDFILLFCDLLDIGRGNFQVTFDAARGR